MTIMVVIHLIGQTRVSRGDEWVLMVSAGRTGNSSVAHSLPVYLGSAFLLPGSLGRIVLFSLLFIWSELLFPLHLVGVHSSLPSNDE